MVSQAFPPDAGARIRHSHSDNGVRGPVQPNRRRETAAHALVGGPSVRHDAKPRYIERCTSAAELGTYTENVKANSGDVTKLRGRYLFLWERGADRVWRVRQLLYNHTPQ